MAIVATYTGICKAQHDHMYDEVENAGFTKEITRDFIAKYQGYYALTENGVDYLVEPKAIEKYPRNEILTSRYIVFCEVRISLCLYVRLISGYPFFVHVHG